jgi:pterin-4a-carbinolamine dehydratase
LGTPEYLLREGGGLAENDLELAKRIDALV